MPTMLPGWQFTRGIWSSERLGILRTAPVMKGEPMKPKRSRYTHDVPRAGAGHGECDHATILAIKSVVLAGTGREEA
jgi:hypothetical protein